MPYPEPSPSETDDQRLDWVRRLDAAVAARDEVEKTFTPVAPAVIIKGDSEGPRVNTNDPDFRKDMSPEDEKKTGHDGRPAVLGKPWSLAGSGLWLCIGCVKPPVGERRPKVPMEGFWNALELPSDLADDPRT